MALELRPEFAGEPAARRRLARILSGAAGLDGVGEPLASLLRTALCRNPSAPPSAAWPVTALRKLAGN